MSGILDARFVGERDVDMNIPVLVPSIDPAMAGIFVGGCNDQVGGLLTAPGEYPDALLYLRTDNGLHHLRLVHAVDECLYPFEQLQLLAHFLLLADEVLPVRLAKVGEYAERRPDDGLQLVHLVRLGNARLKDRQLMLLLHLPDRQGYADLGVIALGTANDLAIRAQ